MVVEVVRGAKSAALRELVTALAALTCADRRISLETGGCEPAMNPTSGGAMVDS